MSEKGGRADDKPHPLVPVLHLFLLQRNLRFDSQDQIRRGVSQLADVLVDVASILQPHVVVNVPEPRGEDVL